MRAVIESELVHRLWPGQLPLERNLSTYSSVSLGQPSCHHMASCISRNRDEAGVVKLADGCNARATNEELSMRKQECFDYSRRAVLGASGALAFLAALRPLRIFAQASGGKLRMGIIGSRPIPLALSGFVL